MDEHFCWQVVIVAQEGISAGMVEVCIAQVGKEQVDITHGTLELSMVLSSLRVGRAQGAVVVDRA